jgi:hypothetical protein
MAFRALFSLCLIALLGLLPAATNASSLLPDPFEPNDDFATAADLGSGAVYLSGLTTDELNEEDFFKWTASSDRDFSVEIRFSADVFHDLDLFLYDGPAAGNLVAQATSVFTDNERITGRGTAGGMFWILVDNVEGNAYTYEMDITGPGTSPVPEPSAALLFCVGAVVVAWNTRSRTRRA